mgnify:CR=1 FL=1
MGDERRAHKLLLGKPEVKCPHGRPKIKWEDKIIWDLKEVGCEGDSKHFVQDRVNSCAYILQK